MEEPEAPLPWVVASPLEVASNRDDVAMIGHVAADVAQRIELLVNQEFDDSPTAPSYYISHPDRFRRLREKTAELHYLLAQYPDAADALALANPRGVKIWHWSHRSYAEAVGACAKYILAETEVGWTNADADMPIVPRGTAHRCEAETDRAISMLGGDAPTMSTRRSDYQPVQLMTETLAKAQTAITNFYANYIDPGEVAAAKLAALMEEMGCEPERIADTKTDSKKKTPKSLRVLKAISFLNDYYRKLERGKAPLIPENAIISEHLGQPVESSEVKNLCRQLREYRHLINKPADS